MSLIETNWNPDRRMLRHFGIALSVVAGGLGAFVWWRGGLFGLAPGPAGLAWAIGTLWTVAAAALVLAAAAPAWLRPVYIAMAWLTRPIGLAVSYVLMAMLYYGLITPIGVLSRWCGRDPLRLRAERDARTYWEPRSRDVPVERYFRQF